MSGRDGDGPSGKGALAVISCLCLLLTIGLRVCDGEMREAESARGREAMQRMAVEDLCRGITRKLRMQANGEQRYVQACADACLKEPNPNGLERVVCTVEYETRHPPVEDAPVQTEVASRAPPRPGGGSAAGGPAAFPVAAGEAFRDCTDACPELVVIPPGEFLMGSTNTYDYQALPRHRVRVEAPLAVGRFPVTRGEYAAFARDTGRGADTGCLASRYVANAAKPTWPSPGFAQTDAHPVVCVSWADAQAYVGWLSQRTGQSYRLLTEPEWEYAARAGTTTPLPWGDEPGQGHANCAGCGPRPQGVATTPVQDFAPNGFGLYDMLGNVRQWVEDCWYSDAYKWASDASAMSFEGATVASERPDQRPECRARTVRGIGWNDGAYSLDRSVDARREGSTAPGSYAMSSDETGFRVARLPAE